MRQIVFLSLCALFFAGSPASGMLAASEKDRARELQKERDKLAKEKDPADRAKIGVKISEILLEGIGDAVRSEDYRGMETQLAEYADTIQGAHQTLVDSGRDAQKKSGGFKDLEVALRKHLLRFDDLARLLNLDRRPPIEKVKGLASGIRNKLLNALFPSR